MRPSTFTPVTFVAGIAIAFVVSIAAPSALRAQQDVPHPDNRPPDSHPAQHDDHAPPLAAKDHPQDDKVMLGYRRDHPGAAARCHDGFFTKTSDRKRACSRHGGIDVWLLP